MSNAAAAAKANEPSMDEILASIRQIISDDDKAAPGGSRGANAEQPEPARDVLEDEADALNWPITAFDDEGDAEDDVDTDDQDGRESMAEIRPAAIASEAPAVERPVDAKKPSTSATPAPAPASQGQQPLREILSPKAGQAVATAFDSLNETVQTRDPRSLEDVVREMLRPMLREWLDDNLPSLVERLVRTEIERVSRG